MAIHTLETARGNPVPPEVDHTVVGYLTGEKPAYRGEVWFSMPPNHEWSALVIDFDLREFDGSLVLALGDVDIP